MSVMTSIAALSRRRPSHPLALSVSGAWHRLSMLGTLAVLTIFPWTTTTGCEGKSAPTAWTGVDLLAHSLHNEPLIALAPLGLFVVAALAFVAAQIQGRPRLVSQIASFIVAAPSVLFTFVMFAAPTAGDVEQHHAAFAVGVAVLLAFFLDAAVRLALGVREWWLARSGCLGAASRLPTGGRAAHDDFERSAIASPV